MWCGFTPVISPTARGEDGKIYNCNADVAAPCGHRAECEAAGFHVRCSRLAAQSQGCHHRDRPSADRRSPGLKAAGIVDKGMIPKVDSAVAAIRSGVEKVSFVDGRTPHAVLLEIFTDRASARKLCYSRLLAFKQARAV